MRRKNSGPSRTLVEYTGITMTKKEVGKRARIPNLPRDLLSIAFNNVGKVRRDVLDVVFQEIGRYVQDFADNYTIKVRAELNFERKKDKARAKR